MGHHVGEYSFFTATKHLLPKLITTYGTLDEMGVFWPLLEALFYYDPLFL